MTRISLTVNGRAVAADIEPRTHLADFLREHELMTGTHLGCEHGICGACTLLIDGVPARSCITYAVTCSGAEVTTIEGLDDDETAAALRRAFSEEHGLQCGYCTPGMLVTARDIVRRLPGIDNDRIREELGGNLCRCTGYVGIVRAIRKVLDDRQGTAAEEPASSLIPVGAGHAASEAPSAPAEARREAVAAPAESADAAAGPRPTNEIRRTLTVTADRDTVWTQFGNTEALARCMPGATVDRVEDDGRIVGRMRAKAGPIAAVFDGEARHERASDDFRGHLRGAGRDKRTGTRITADVDYMLEQTGDGAATQVRIVVRYGLSGALAQFARGGIVEDLADRLAEQFAANLERLLSGELGSEEERPAELDAGSLVFSVVWNRIRRAFAKVFGRR